MSRGKRYNDDQKLNLKKVGMVVLAIAAIVGFVFAIKNLTKKKEQTQNYFTETAYFIVLQDGKMGVINSKGEIVVEPEVNDMMIAIPDSKKQVFICYENVDNTTKTKARDANKAQLFTDYSSVEVIDNFDNENNIWYENNVLRVSKDGKYGLIDLDGKELAACVYDKIDPIRGIKNSLLIQKEGKYGLVNNQGDVIVECEYENITTLTNNYMDGYIVKNSDGKYGIISINKEKIFDCKYDDIKHVGGNDLYVVKEDGKWKITNKTGDKFVEIDYEDVTYVNSDIIIAKVNGKYGVFGTDKSEKIKADYDMIKYACTDNYIAQKDGKFGILNTAGEEAIPFEYSSLTFNETTYCIFGKKADDNKTYLIDRNHEVKISGTDVQVLDGYIRVKADDEYKFYNFKLEEKSNRDAYANHTLYAAKNDGKFGLVNRDGTLVVKYEYDDITEQNNYGYVAVKKDGKWGVIDQYGNIVVEPKFEISNVSDVMFIGKWHSVENMKTKCFITE